MIAELVMALAVQVPPDPSSQAEIAKEIRAVCKQVLCRPPATIRLKRPDGSTFTSTSSEPMPIVTGEALVTVMPGETVHIEARVEGKRLVELKAVNVVTAPQRTLTLRLTQEASIDDGVGMMLKVDSPFPGTLKYRLGMMLLDGDRLLATSSCPVRPGARGYEHWPHPIFQIVATEFGLVDPSSEAGNRCE